MACAINISLFANRVCSIAFHEYIDVIEGKLTYFCITISAIYGTFILFYTPIICFNSKALAWIPEPLSEIDDSKESEKYVMGFLENIERKCETGIFFFRNLVKEK